MQSILEAQIQISMVVEYGKYHVLNERVDRKLSKFMKRFNLGQ